MTPLFSEPWSSHHRGTAFGSDRAANTHIPAPRAIMGDASSLAAIRARQAKWMRERQAEMDREAGVYTRSQFRST
jgi:hypothetical protein